LQATGPEFVQQVFNELEFVALIERRRLEQNSVAIKIEKLESKLPISSSVKFLAEKQ
jgi:hypothetical protein